MRSVVSPSSRTPTAWWPSEDRRTSTGEARAPGPVAGGKGKGCWGREVRQREGPREPATPCFCSVFEGELSETIPVVHASIAGCRIIGRMCVGKAGGRRRGTSGASKHHESILNSWTLPQGSGDCQAFSLGGPWSPSGVGGTQSHCRSRTLDFLRRVIAK